MDDSEDPVVKRESPHITLDDGATLEDGRRGRPAANTSRTHIGRSVSRSRSRQPISVNTGTYGLPIGYRTLSIHVSDSQHIAAHDTNVQPLKGDTGDYFENLDFHTLDTKFVCQRLGVNQNKGLSEDEVTRRRLKHGLNTLPRPKVNYFRKLLSYVFGGFCSVLWVGR